MPAAPLTLLGAATPLASLRAEDLSGEVPCRTVARCVALPCVNLACRVDVTAVHRCCLRSLGCLPFTWLGTGSEVASLRFHDSFRFIRSADSHRSNGLADR